MFIGHFGIGFGAKRIAPKASLGLLFLAAQFLDLLWPNLLLLDLEHVNISPGITKATPLDFVHYPISHSLVLVLGWGLLVGLICWSFMKDTKVAAVIFLCVISHWFLDLIVHRPDLPLLPGASIKLGFGLWNYPLVTAIVEGIIFLGGVALYFNSTTAKNAFGKYGLLVLIIFFVIIQIGNMIGPPPTSVNAIAWVSQLQWVFIILGYFVDKNRQLIAKRPTKQKLATR